ncbi:tyrosine recombinase XerC [Novosphingobium sp. FSW06-99]|uniref:site-specific integrase n=1 Tax=Novosphingobium sp. FSW06-99 TaxID=1739113 RepID=UPI000AEB4202|nr:tyrosine-type recombinase/integrase [Novosphingobium sp. FSW06-99]
MSDLPKGVYAQPDRHGKIRYRFQRKGWPSSYLHGDPGSAEFHRAYAEIIERGPKEKISARSPMMVTPRSLDDLFAKHKKQVKWSKKAARTRLVQSRIIERFLDRCDQKGRRYGERPTDAVTVTWLENILAGMAETPAAANVLRKVLSGLMDTAIKIGWRDTNPARLTDTFKEGEGSVMWTELDIAQYRAAHPLGTMARLVLELALNTSGRRCNVAGLTRDNIRGNEIVTAHVKGNNESTVPLLPTTRAALEALPAAPIKHLVTTQFGKRFTVDGFGNRVRKWCDAAGLPDHSLHGIRKAVARRVAESGGTDAEGQAITGHKKAETFAYYRAKANRSTLAAKGINAAFEAFDSQPAISEGSQPQKNEGISDD